MVVEHTYCIKKKNLNTNSEIQPGRYLGQLSHDMYIVRTPFFPPWNKYRPEAKHEFDPVTQA